MPRQEVISPVRVYAPIPVAELMAVSNNFQTRMLPAVDNYVDCR